MITEEMIEAKVRQAWDSISDEHNKWGCLSMDEREAFCELVAAALALLPGEPIGEMHDIPDGMGLRAIWFNETPRAGTKLFAAPVPQPVAVKALEWKEYNFHTRNAKTICGYYEVQYRAFGDGVTKWYWRRSGDPLTTSFVTEEEAKAAAQADYETRILGALVNPVPSEATMPERIAPRYPQASKEPLEVIRANECESQIGSLATSRFQALWNEIERLRALPTKGRP